VRGLKGKQAAIEIVDAQTGAWGNVGVGRIVFTDQGVFDGPFEGLPDFGTMGLALVGAPADMTSGKKSASLSEKLVGELGRHLRLEAGQSATVTFLVTWCFPNLRHIEGVPVQGRYYASRFDSAQSVARYVVENAQRLVSRRFCARHLVRLDAALLVPGPDVLNTLDSLPPRPATDPGWPVLGV